MGSETEVGINANTQPFTREMERAAQAAMTAGQRIQSAFREAGANMANAMTAAMDRINADAKASIGVLEHYKGAVAAIGVMAGAFTGVAVGAKRLADETYAASHANELLGSKLGLSAAQAGVLTQALDNINSDSATLEGGLGKMTEKLLNNEEAFAKLGVATRDSDGHFRNSLDILKDVNARFLEFREGTDRNIEMQRIYGESWQDMVPLLNLTQEAVAKTEARMRELGLVMGEEHVEAAHAYDAAMKDVGMVIAGMKKAVGDALMPVLTKLGEWFSSIGPAAVTVIKGSVGGLTAAFWTLKNGVVAVWEVINAMVVTVAEPIRALAESFIRLFQGDFTGARTAIQGIGTNIKTAWAQAMAEIEQSSRETRDKIYQLFATPTPMAALAGGWEGATPDGKQERGGKNPAGKGYTDAGWDMEVLAWERRTQAELEAIDQDNKAAALAREVADLKERAGLTSKANAERIQLLGEAAEKIGAQYGYESEQYRAALRAMQQAARDHAAEQARIEAAIAERRQQARLGEHETERDRLANLRALGQITAEAELQALARLEARKYQIELDYARQRAELVQDDPAAYEQARAQIEAIERAHAKTMGKIHADLAKEQGALWSSLGPRAASLWDKGLQAMMTGTLKWKNALRAVMAELVQWFAVDVVGQQVKTWLAGELAKTTATTTGTTARAAVEQTASTQSILMGASAAVKHIIQSAWETFAAAFKAIAGIPFVGPAMAPGVAAGAMATVMAVTASVPSAAMGYDIPAGVNPLTQLHQREMVLPEQHADTIRSLGQLGQLGAGLTINIHALDARDVERTLKTGGALARALKDMERRFTR